jgi:hypothetical protein
MPHSVITLAAEASSESEGANPYLVGAGALLVLLVLLFVVVAFGGGREHS